MRQLPALLKNLAELGERHQLYGVRREHFAVAGAALFAALEQTLGAEFDLEMRGAWAHVYHTVADAMQKNFPP